MSVSDGSMPTVLESSKRQSNEQLFDEVDMHSHVPQRAFQLDDFRTEYLGCNFWTSVVNFLFANCRISKVDINQYVALWHPCAYHHFNTSFSQTCDWVRRNMFIDAMSESAVSD
jgi:hypothetical protein